MPVSRRQFLGTTTLAAAQWAGDAKPRTKPSRQRPVEAGDWAFSDVDAAIATQIQGWLPRKLFDVHAHLYRTRDLGKPCPGLPAAGPKTVGLDVWRTRLGEETGVERLAGGLFVPYPVKHCDVDAGNEFVAAQVESAGLARGLMVVTPQSSREKVEECLGNPNIVGFKPYHVFAPVKQTFDAALEEYVPEWIWQVADAHGAIILLHLVRTGALSDPGNQRTILTFCAKYPNATLLLAHAGRGFHAPNTIRALPALKGLNNVYFDSAAICEPDALMAILKTFGPRRLMWGSDFPVSHQRGKCVTVGDAFSWICPRRIDVDPAAPVCHPTLVGLESMRALGLAAQLMDLSAEDLEDIFLNNALRLLRLQSS